MSECKKLFIVSDIHGHYSLLKEVLDSAGFDDDNEEHLFICCGDLFDRGRENRKVYDFVRKLKHKVLIKGNHDERLSTVLSEKRVDMYDVYNGLGTTLGEFFGLDIVGDYGNLNLPRHGKMAGNLCRFITEMKDYFETENYIFVHGWLPIEKGESLWLLENWRNADEKAWHASRSLEWHKLYNIASVYPEKTLICGHRPTRLACKIDPSREENDSSIFYGRGMIAIDAGSIRSGRMNLLVLEDNLI